MTNWYHPVPSHQNTSDAAFPRRENTKGPVETFLGRANPEWTSFVQIRQKRRKRVTRHSKVYGDGVRGEAHGMMLRHHSRNAHHSDRT